MKILKAIIASTLLASVAACASPKVASTAWKSQCGSINEVAYCYHEVGTPDLANPVIVFNHGLEDSERVFLEPTSVPSSYPELIAKMPAGTRILTLSWGKAFLLTGYANRTKKPVTATLDRYMEVMQDLANQFKLFPPFNLVGHSMGGYNSAQLCAKYPLLWSHCVLINPMILKDATDPWNLLQICPGCLLIKPNYDSLAQYRADRPTPAQIQPKTLVTACSTDIFKLYDGAKEYAAKAHATFVDGAQGCDHWHYPVDEILRELR